MKSVWNKGALQLYQFYIRIFNKYVKHYQRRTVPVQARGQAWDHTWCTTLFLNLWGALSGTGLSIVGQWLWGYPLPGKLIPIALSSNAQIPNDIYISFHLKVGNDIFALNAWFTIVQPQSQDLRFSHCSKNPILCSIGVARRWRSLYWYKNWLVNTFNTMIAKVEV